MLDCCIPLETVQREGITLTQAACLAKCNGALTDVFPYGSVDVDEFRDMVKRACSSSDYHLIVSYSRKHFQQTGDGHFSPIGGYSPAHDMALILDTARFKYPPHWVKLNMLYEAMAYEDPAIGKPRGFLKVMASRTLHSVLFSLDCSVEDEKWARLSRWVAEVIENVKKVKNVENGENGENAKNVVESKKVERDSTNKSSTAPADLEGENHARVHDLVVRLCMSADPYVLASRTDTEDTGCGDSGTCVQSDAVETLLSEIEMLHLVDDVRVAVSRRAQESAPGRTATAHEVQKRLMLVLMLEDVIVSTAEAAGWDDDLLASLKHCLMNESKEKYRVVGHEVEYLKDQFRALRELTQAC